MKDCTRCQVSKSDTDFPTSRQGWLMSPCRKCRSDIERDRRRDAGMKPRNLSLIQDGRKRCTKCNEMKPLEDFSPTARGLGGLSSSCKPCFADAYRDKVKAREATARYRQRHRARHLAQHRVCMFERRTRLQVKADGTVTDDFLNALYTTPNCHYCGELTPEDLRTADHRVALAKGGAHSATNLVMACWSCNSSKRDMSETEFRNYQNNVALRQDRRRVPQHLDRQNSLDCAAPLLARSPCGNAYP